MHYICVLYAKTYCMEENNTPKYKLNTDKNDPRYIADGMNEFERNVKRVGDLILAGICLIVFSPLFLICYLWWLMQRRTALLFFSMRMKNA